MQCALKISCALVLFEALAAVKQREIDERVTLDDTQVLAVLTKMVKQRKDAAQQFDDANRADLADNERAEIEILETFLTQSNMLVLNRGDRPTFANGESQPPVDLTIANKAAYNKNRGAWEVLQRHTCSDTK